MAHGYLGRQRRPGMNRKQRSERNSAAAAASPGHGEGVQGEGNYDAAREFDEAERARRRAKEEDPALLRKPPTRDQR